MSLPPSLPMLVLPRPAPRPSAIRSGQYMSNQPAESRGWQSLGGLRTGRQLSEATAVAVTTAAGPAAPLPGMVVSAGGIRALSSTKVVVSQLGAAPAAVAAAAAAPVMAAAAAAGQLGPGALRLGFTSMCAAPEEHRMLYAGG